MESAADAKVNYSEMNEVCFFAQSFFEFDFIWFFATKADQSFTIDVAMNALKAREKSERPVHHKDIAQTVKNQLDQSKGLVLNAEINIRKFYTSCFCHIGVLGMLLWAAHLALLWHMKRKRKVLSFSFIRTV